MDEPERGDTEESVERAGPDENQADSQMHNVEPISSMKRIGLLSCRNEEWMDSAGEPRQSQLHESNLSTFEAESKMIGLKSIYSSEAPLKRRRRVAGRSNY